MFKHLQRLLLIVALCMPWVTQAQGDTISTFPFTCSFEDATDIDHWSFTNSSNGWYIGSATSNGGSNSLYVSDNNGTSANYSGSACVSYAYLTFEVETSGQYAIQFDWKCAGESTYDFLRVAVASASTTLPTDYSSWTSTGVPTGFEAIDGGTKLNLQGTSWQTLTTTISVTTPGVYRLLFVWRNDGSVYNQPPACIDNVMVNELTCPAPTGVTVSDITVSGANVAWTAGGTETAWEVVCGDQSAFTTTPSYTITGLNGNTPYVVGVRAICGAGDTSFLSTAAFRTPCVSISTMPYSNGFEDDPHYSTVAYAEAFPNCWTRINDASSTYNYYPYLTNTSTYVHSGSVGMYWYQTSTSTYADNEYAVLPPIDLDVFSISDITMSFYAKTTSTSYHPQPIIGVMSDVNDVTTFVGVDTLSATALTTTWQMFTVSFAEYTGTGNLIAIKWTRPSSASYMAIDDIFLTDDWCDMPGEVDAAPGAYDVTISWEPNEGTSFTVFLGNDTVENITDTFYTFTTLTPNTPYQYGVAVECTNSNSQFVTGATRTQCVPVDTLPYEIDFNSCPTGSSVVFDPCWTTYNNYSTANYPYVSGGYLYMYLYSSTNINAMYGYAIMPPLDEEISENDLELTFDIWKSSTAGYCSGVVVALFENGFYDENHPIDTLAIIVPTATTQASATTQYVLVPIDSLTAGKRVGFLYQNQDPTASGSYYYTYIDNVSLHLAPSCSHVVDLEVPAVTAGNALVKWNPGPAGEYYGALVEYRDTADANWTTVTVSESEVVLTGLDSNTYYEVRVAAVCDGDDQADYEYTSFKTAAFGCILGDDAIDVTIGTGATTNSYVPSYSFYNYSYSQQFFKASEIGGSGALTQITLTPAAVTSQRTYEIYMGQSSDTSATSFITPDGLTLVYNGGNIPLVANQPVTFVLTTPFNYSDTSNLVVIFRDMTGSYSSGTTWKGDNAWSNASRYVYRDASEYSVPPTDDGSASSFRNQINFFGGECLGISSCSAPAAWVTGITRDSVYIEWIPGATETAWDIYYELGDSLVYIGSSSETHYEVSDLNASTDYKFYIAANCGDETKMTSVTATTGPDDAYDILPFVCTFDSMDDVWLRAGDNQENKWYISTVDNNRMLMVSDDGGVTNSYDGSSISASHAYARLVLPAGDYVYSYDWKAVGESSYDYMLAYIVPDNFNPIPGSYSVPANAIRIDGGSYLNQSNSWQTQSDVITIADSGIYKMVFTWRNDGSVGNNPPAAVDNVMLSLSTCSRPSALILDSVTTNTATFHWIDTTGTALGGYVVEYNGIVDYTMNTTYTATNLSPATFYTFRVYSICDEGDTSAARSLNTYTLCAPIVPPHFEDFNNWGTGSSVHVPMCWTYGSDYSTSYPYISNSYNHSGANGGALYMYDGSSAGSPNLTWFALPELDATVAANQTQLLFYVYRNTTSYEHPVMVGVGNNSTMDSTVVWIDTVIPVYNQWNEYEVALDSYTGNGQFIFFATNVANYSYSYPYIDDITLEMIPSCQRPNNLYATNATPNTVDLGWNDRAGASQWAIEYGPAGFQIGTGTIVYANSNPFTVTGIPAAYQGEFYVKAICGVGDTGEYSRYAQAFSTTQIPATLPYDYNFEDPAEWANWQTSTNTTTNWFRGSAVASTGSYSMYVSADAGATYKPYSFNAVVNAAAYRDIDFGNVDSSFTVSFDVRAGGNLGTSYDGLMVFLIDPSLPTEASSSNITSPWGNVNDLYVIAYARIDTNWHTATASFDTISGIKRVAFFWFNQNTGSETSYGPSLLEPAAIDNIHIDYSACPRPIATTLDAVTSTTASLSWVGPSVADYEVIYRPTAGTAADNVFIPTTTNNIDLSGLDPLTQYSVWVRKICGNDTSLTSDVFHFVTEFCDNFTEAYSYDTTMTASTSTYGPIGYSFYNYGYVQTLIDSARFATLEGDITAFAFNPTVTTAGDEYENMSVWMANVPETNLGTGAILPDSTTHVFVQVINNQSFSYSTTGWQMHGFDTAFTWDGHSNVLVAVKRDNGSYTSGATFAAHSTSDVRTRYWYQDSGPIDFDNPTATSSGSQNLIGDMMFYTCGAACAQPVMLPVAELTYESATISWVSNATDFEVAVKAANEATWPAETAVNATTYAITGLTPATTYQYRVRAICDATEGLISEWTNGTFTTDSLPCFAPTELQNTAVELTTATFSWTANGEETAWRIHVWNASFDQEYDVTTNPATVTGLTQNTTYNATVSALCGGGVLESDPSNTVEFTTAMCPAPTGVTATNVTATSATITWTGSAASYSLEYGPGNFSQGSGIMVNDITGTSYTITGLNPERGYTVMVRAHCDAQNSSEWSERGSFTTLEEQGIDDVDAASVRIYPNPTSDATTIALSGVNGEVTVTVVDMNGRTVRTETMNCAGDCTKRMEVSGLAAGSYFVRISGEGVNTVKKLVVK